MSLVPNRPVPPDNLDGRLRAFFRTEMPSTWPAPPRTAPTLPSHRPGPRRSGLFRSRLALAASVALLALGSLLVAGKVGPTPAGGTPGITLPPEGGTGEKTRLPPKGTIKTSLSLEQDPAGETQIKVDVMEDLSPSR